MTVPTAQQPTREPEDSGFDQVVIELVRVLRRAGLRVSPAESLDAIRAVALVGFGQRAHVRGVLAATLVKREAERAVFDRVFDRFFAADAGGHRGVADLLRAQGMDPQTLADLRARIDALGVVGGGGGLAGLMAGGAELDEAIATAMRRANVAAMVSAMQVGLYAMRTLDALGVPAIERSLHALRGVDDAGDQLADALGRTTEMLRRRVRTSVREDFERRNPDRYARSRAQRLEEQALGAIDVSDQEAVHKEVHRLGRALQDRMERARRRARRGRLDMRATLRAARRTGGVPMRWVFRPRRPHRPRLVVLCDVSDSVRAAARFFLVLVHAMQKAFSRTRTFVFVSRIVETTALFERHNVQEFLARAFVADGFQVGGSSDYGRVLGAFVSENLPTLDRRTTVVVLGDARSNYLDPNVGALAILQSRVARVIWFNPEPTASWGFGDSEMRRYEKHCQLALPVRTLGQLRAAVSRLGRALTR